MPFIHRTKRLMPRGRKTITGPLTALANNRKQLEKNYPKVVELIRREMGSMRSVPHTNQPVHFGSSLRIDLQRAPYQRDGRWWANYAVQTGSKVHGSLEVECDVEFGPGELAEAMIEACANAQETRQQGQKWVVISERQYVLWQTRRPAGVFDA